MATSAEDRSSPLVAYFDAGSTGFEDGGPEGKEDGPGSIIASL